MTERIAGALASTLAARSRVVLRRPEKAIAAVLVPLLAVDGEPHVLYTRRSALLPRHQGQIAFPGGRHHPDEDRDLQTTALREAHEEIGLSPTDVRILGALDDIETMATRFVITPFVGVVPYPYAWRPCEAEVDAIFTVPLRVLRAPETLRREVWDFSGRRVPIDTYAVDGHVIWGATQRITRNLLQMLPSLD
ncbi:MAG TPA: CoA pyrophosphatase [Candidatus Binatia bacterium]|jgi:8-oxo-dGTP pyrophosphatase MutT (NUDIX family)|nr:CoA pyrophosphatase [Candidatus Binatia bacterium]